MFKKPLYTSSPDPESQPAQYVPLIAGIPLAPQYLWTRYARRGGVGGISLSEGRTLLPEGRCRYGVVLVTTG